MDKKTYCKVVGTIFFIIAILHALRIWKGWEAVLGGTSMPLWVSWVAIVIAGYLGICGFQLAKK